MDFINLPSTLDYSLVMTLAVATIAIEMCRTHLAAMKCDSVDYLIDLMLVTVAAVMCLNESVVCVSLCYAFVAHSKCGV